ncbi:MAG: ABC transporter permease [Bacteroidota bacterium]
MKSGENISPPKWAIRFIEWYCKPELAEDLIGDLNEYFERNVEEIGARRARIIYVIDSFKFLRGYTIRTLKFVNLLINWIMIGSYIKTSGRNVMRNKLFSTINIVGLAISMSVGLLLIAFLVDLKSYDKFHEKGNRIYRITNLPTFNKEHSSKFASTSIKTGKLIAEKVSGVEDVATIRNGFGGDAKIDDKVIPISGLWADPSFLKIFTFPLVKGNIATALKDPFSIVLTETASKKFFGDEDAMGKIMTLDTVQYHVTGVMKDVPFFSHVRFESLCSLSTFEVLNKDEKRMTSWANMWQNYVYLLLPENGDVASVKSQLDAIAEEQNKGEDNIVILLALLPLYDIVLGEDLSNTIGAAMPMVVLWIIGGLALVVILSACFNYTNLSIARSLRRFKEVGLRKVIGAGKGQVRQQFLAEAIIVSIAALVFSFGIFLILRPQFMNIAPELGDIVKLDITLPMIVAFFLFSVAVGVLAGFLPATFFSKVSIISALRDTGSIKVFRRVSFRRVLVVVQYTLTLMFITATLIGFTQYKSILSFDLGFNTENIINLQLRGNKPEIVINSLKELPEVIAISKSQMVTSVGTFYGGQLKYKDSRDSVDVWYNAVDENYIPLHGHKLVAGSNFIARPTTEEATSEVIVNEQVLKRFNLLDANKALGEELTLDRKKLKIVGVMKDYHYGKVDSPIDPVIFKYMTEENHNGYLNIKIQSGDPVATMAKIETLWKGIDKIHPISAGFYDDAIEKAYNEFSAMIKIIGFLSFLAISIASMGMFGMVVFTTETRLKEISIRKVMGASSGNLIYLLSRNFMLLLCISAVIALPATYFFFDAVVLTSFPYHNPIGPVELFAGLLGVLLIAFMMIGSQTLKATRSNPAEVLKSE